MSFQCLKTCTSHTKATVVWAMGLQNMCLKKWNVRRMYLVIFIFVTGWWVFFKQTLSSIFYNCYLSHEKFLHESSWCLSLLRVVNIYSELLCFICLSSVVSMVSLNFMSIRLGRLQNILLITSCQIMN